MESPHYDVLFKNEEKRTEIILSLEAYYAKVVGAIEAGWKSQREVNRKDEDYAAQSQQFLGKLQLLNKELRDIPTEGSSQFEKDVCALLKLEEANYKVTLKVFLEKLACFDLLKKEEEDCVVIAKERDIAVLIQYKAKIREEINDFITSLKYQYK